LIFSRIENFKARFLEFPLFFSESAGVIEKKTKRPINSNQILFSSALNSLFSELKKFLKKYF